MKFKDKNKGLTLFVAMVLMGTLLLIATGIVSLAVRQSVISASGRESQDAFYAADTGIECALFWDVQNQTGISSFSTSTGSTIFCNQDASNPSNPIPTTVGGNAVSTFRVNFLPNPYCAIVTVTKDYINDALVTTIESKGYNTCDPSNPRRVERAVRAVY